MIPSVSASLFPINSTMLKREPPPYFIVHCTLPSGDKMVVQLLSPRPLPVWSPRTPAHPSSALVQPEIGLHSSARENYPECQGAGVYRTRKGCSSQRI